MKPGNDLAVAGLRQSAGCVSWCVSQRVSRSVKIHGLTC